MPEAIGGTYNLGTGHEISIGALAELIGRLAGRPITLSTESIRQRPGGSEVERLLADNQRSRTTLGWSPSVTLEDGLRRTIGWFGMNLDRYRAAVYNL